MEKKLYRRPGNESLNNCGSITSIGACDHFYANRALRHIVYSFYRPFHTRTCARVRVYVLKCAIREKRRRGFLLPEIQDPAGNTVLRGRGKRHPCR